MNNIQWNLSGINWLKGEVVCWCEVLLVWGDENNGNTIKTPLGPIKGAGIVYYSIWSSAQTGAMLWWHWWWAYRSCWYKGNPKPPVAPWSRCLAKEWFCIWKMYPPLTVCFYFTVHELIVLLKCANVHNNPEYHGYQCHHRKLRMSISRDCHLQHNQFYHHLLLLLTAQPMLVSNCYYCSTHTMAF